LRCSLGDVAMPKRRNSLRRILLVGLLGGSLVLGGCASSAPSEPVEESTAATQQDMPYRLVKLGSVTPPVFGSGTFPLSDTDGYAFTVAVSAMTISTTSSIENAKPGFVTVSSTFLADLTLTNTTAGRNAPIGTALSNLSVNALWPQSSPVCSQPGVITIADAETGTAAGLCALTSWPILGDAATVSAGGSVTKSLPVTTKFDVEEASAPDLIAALEAPLGWAAAAGSGLSPNGAPSCLLSGAGDIDGDPRLYWASTPIDGCAIPTISSYTPPTADSTTVASATTTIREVSLRASGETLTLDRCPAGNVVDITRGMSGITTLQFEVTANNSDAYAVSCDTNQLNIDFSLDGESSGSPQQRANLYAGADGTSETDLVGGKLYAFCPTSSENVACQAIWHDGDLVIRGIISQLADATTADKLTRLRDWFTLNIPTILTNLAKGQ